MAVIETHDYVFEIAQTIRERDLTAWNEEKKELIGRKLPEHVKGQELSGSL